MDKTSMKIQALAKAALCAGEPSVKVPIAGVIVTIFACDPMPETAPASKLSLVANLRPERDRRYQFSRN